MSTKENVPKIYAAMSNIQKDLAKQGISKDGKNIKQNYSFRGIDAIYKHIAPLMAENGVVMQHNVLDQNQNSYKTANGNTMFHTFVTVEYTYISVADGSSMQTRCIGEAMDTGDKSTNKAISAAFKYNALNTFCIPVEGMEDADADSPEVGAVTKPTAVNVEPKPALNVSGEIDIVLSSITRLVSAHMKNYGLSKDDIKRITGLPSTAGQSLEALKKAEKKLVEYGLQQVTPEVA